MPSNGIPEGKVSPVADVKIVSASVAVAPVAAAQAPIVNLAKINAQVTAAPVAPGNDQNLLRLFIFVYYSQICELLNITTVSFNT